jgi:hypothetical protein
MTFAALYAIVVGVSMIGQWVFSIARRQVPGPEAGSIVGRGSVEMLFHWAAELITALALLAGGVGLLLDWIWGVGVYLIAMGMLLYAVVNSSGYFAQKREWPMLGVFAVLLILALISLVVVI